MKREERKKERRKERKGERDRRKKVEKERKKRNNSKAAISEYFYVFAAVRRIVNVCMSLILFLFFPCC